MTTISSIDARYAQDQVRSAAIRVTASVANLVSGRKADAGVADLSVGTVLAARVGTLRVAVGNASQAKSLLETAKGGLDTILDLLQQQKNLAVKSADDSLSDNERAFLDQEFQAIVSEVDRISSTANFNGKLLLNGSISGNAGTATASGLSNEQYSLLQSKDISTSGTVASGSLQNSHATVGENYITFGNATATGTVKVSIDADLLDAGTTGGATAVQTVSFSVTNGDSAATVAAAFVAAVQSAINVTTSAYSNFTQFDFASNSSNGVVTIKAKEAGTHLNGYGFSADSNATGVTATLGTTNTNIIDTGNDGTVDQTREQLFTQGAVTTAANGIFKSIAANNIGETAFSGLLTFGADTDTGAASINGVKAVGDTQITGAGTAGGAATFTFGNASTVTITVEAAPNDNLAISDALSAAQTAQAIADILNAQSLAGGNDAQYFNFTVNADRVVATQKNFITNGATLAIVNAIIANGTGGFTAGGDATVGVGAADVTGVAGTAGDATFSIRDGSGNTVGEAITIGIAANTGTAAYTATQIATFFADTLNNTATSAARLFTFVDNADGTVSVTAKDKGTDINKYTFDFDMGTYGTFTTTLNGADAVADTVIGATTATLGTNKNIAPSDLTFDSNLLGDLSNLKGYFSLGVGNNGVTDYKNNTVQFTVDVNGTTYTSNIIQLLGASSSSTISNTIAAGTKITFQSANGPVDSNGAYTNNGFQLNVESAITLASVTNSSTGQDSLNDVVTDLQNQLDSISINQNRSFSLDEINASSSDHRITAAVGTILEGLRGFDAIGTNRLSYAQGDIRLLSDQYGDTGTHGDIKSFTVDRNTDTITTTINGEVYTAYLNSGNAPSVGGIVAFGTDLDSGTNNGTYNATTKIISLGSSTGETAKLNFFSSSTTDGKVLQIDLGHVASNISQININSDEGESALEAALNAVFNVSENDSLSFQVGAESSDTIGVSIGSAKTVDIYKDDDGIAQTLDIRSIGAAIEAGDVIDNAIRNVISLISDVSAAITSFNSSIQNNQTSIQNADAARSNLLDTDYTTESTRFAEARVRVDAATAVLTQVNARIQNLLGLLQQ